MSTSSARRAAFVILAASLLLAACGSSDTLEGTVVKDGIGCKVTQVDRRTDAPTITKLSKDPKDVTKKDIDKGKGCASDSETFLTLDLVGATALDGKTFVDTFEGGRPVTARLNAGQLLPGLETGLEGMKVGGRRTIAIPAELAYGSGGSPEQGVGADKSLIFVVDLVAVTSSPLYCNAAQAIPAGPEGSGKPTTVEMPVEAPTDKTTTKVLTPGTGAEVTEKDYVTVHYLGVSCSSGQQFDSSWDSGSAFTAALKGANDPTRSVIPGWTDGLVGQKVGSLVQLEIPADDAYGAQGQGSIAPNDPLVFVIQIISASPEAPVETTTTLPGGDASTTSVPEATTTSAP
ncbi:MAG: FKBP-type peptidyl-prolyl cis-trans isomerase [Actinobacteria bacterium]|nr:FKBP-type peptidyl-prolyl cis-trans isomerase [Actinomycetota bacterium]